MIKDTLLLLKLQLTNFLGINTIRYTEDSKTKNRTILLMICWIFVFGVSNFYTISLSLLLISMGYCDAALKYVFAIASAMSLLFSLFRAGNVVFDSKDYESLIVLPVSHTSIILSKFIIMYLYDLLVAAISIIPGLIMYGIYVNPSLMFYIYSIIAIFLIPIIPITISLLFGLILKMITSRLKNKNIFTILITLTLLILYFSFGMNLSSDLESLTDFELTKLLNDFSSQLDNTYLPVKWYSMSAFDDNPLGILYLLLSSVSIVSLVIFIVNKLYINLISLIKTNFTKSDFVISKQKNKGVIKTLVFKEFKRYISSPIYVLNTIIGYIIMAILGFVVIFVSPQQIQEVLGLNIVTYMYPYILIIFSSMTSITASSISLEGNMLWVYQTLPISNKNIYISKILLSIFVAIPFYLIGVLGGIVGISNNLYDIIFIIVIPLVNIVFMSILGLKFNMMFPNFDWTNETIPVKQSMPVFLTMIIGAITSIIPMILVISVPTNYVYIIYLFDFVLKIILSVLLFKSLVKDTTIFNK